MVHGGQTLSDYGALLARLRLRPAGHDSLAWLAPPATLAPFGAGQGQGSEGRKNLTQLQQVRSVKHASGPGTNRAAPASSPLGVIGYTPGPDRIVERATDY